MSKAVLGGGLSGLSAAYYLTKSFPNTKITLIEASKRTGGWIRSQRLENGVVFEQAARTIRPAGVAGQNTLALLEDLGLEEKINPIFSLHPAAVNRMIYAKGKLHLLPNSLTSLFKKRSPFSSPLIRSVLTDLLASKEQLTDDSIYNFASRRFGPEVADYLISTMICGICGSDAKVVTAKFLLKEMFEYEQQYGSVTGGVLRSLFKSKPKSDQIASNLSIRAKMERWRIYSLENGLETLTEGLQNNIKNNVNVDFNKTCTEINLSPSNVKLSFDDGSNWEGDHLISAISAKNVANLINKQHPTLGELLGKIPNVSMAVVNLYYTENVIRNPGFGLLVPPKENLPILGVIFDSCVQNVAEGSALTVMMGGSWYEQHFGSNDSPENFLNTAKKYLKLILGIDVEPAEFRVNILKDCIPQYRVGHYENLENVQKYIKGQNLPISLCGSSYHGVGVNDVILSAKNVVDSYGK